MSLKLLLQTSVKERCISYGVTDLRQARSVCLFKNEPLLRIRGGMNV